MTTLEKFRSLGLSESTLKALQRKGFEEPTPIQAECIPLIIKKNTDVLGQAQTGTGKTAAFGLPVLELITPESKKTQALILTPTRELAIQVSEEINSLKYTSKIKTTAIYGGQSIEQQIKRLKEGTQIVVGTPGRVMDLLKRKKLILEHLKFFVLDEADEMLNMGFIDDVKIILDYTPQDKRMLLFSATMPTVILNLAKKYMPNYECIKIKKEALTANLTDQIYFEVRESDKFESLCRIIDIEHEFYGMIFCRTKVNVDTLTNRLTGRGYSAEGIHGDLSQNQRERIFKKFKEKRIHILVATDVAARGIDVNDLTHVINYALPQDPESYVHRIGRTGRAGQEGTAITFITPAEYRKLIFIQKTTQTDIRKEKLPGVNDIINVKKNRIMNNLETIINTGEHKSFNDFATELTKQYDAKIVLSALLKHAFESELDQKRYTHIKEVSSAKSQVDQSGKNRLFVAKGKKDGITKQKLVAYITKEAGVKGELINDVQVFDAFSFVTVPFVEAEQIIHTFKKMGRDNRPLVTKAKGKEASPSRGKKFKTGGKRKFKK